MGLFHDSSNETELSQIPIQSRAMFKAAIILANENNLTIDGRSIEWFDGSTGGSVIEALRLTCRAISDFEVYGIIGPGLSRESHTIANLGNTIGIPVISYSATDPDLSDRNAYPTFRRTCPSDTAAAVALVELFLRFNWTSCIIIHQNDALGIGAAKVINQRFLEKGLIVYKSIVFDLALSKIRSDLRIELVTSGTRIIIVWATPGPTKTILEQALNADVVGPQFTWILSSRLPFGSFESMYHAKLVGTLVIESVIGSIVNAPIDQTLLDRALGAWQRYEPNTYPNSTSVNHYGLFSFDATWTLINILWNFCSGNRSAICLSLTPSSFCFDRRFRQSQSILKIIDKINYIGVSGPISFSQDSTDRSSGSFYSIYNVQRSALGLNLARVLDYSEERGWVGSTSGNVIVWPGNTLIVPKGRSTLSGTPLRVAIIAIDPFVRVENGTQYTGYIIDLIDLLQKQLGFYKILQLVPSNFTYNDAVKGVTNGNYDIVVADLTVTAARRELVSFSNSIFDNALRIIMRKSEEKTVDLLSFLRPFSQSLWLLVFGTCVYAGVVLCLIERGDNEALEDRSALSQLILSTWYAFGNMVGYGVEFHANTAAGRLLTTGLYILSLILVASYTANLASDLTVSKTTQLISGVDDLKSGRIPWNRIGIRVGSASEDYFLREISNGKKNYFPLRSRQESYDCLLNGTIDATFIDSGMGQYITSNTYCDLTLIGEDFDKGLFSIGTPKEWLFRQELDVAILQLRENGTLEDLQQRWFRGGLCPAPEAGSPAITVESIGGLFVTFLIISLFSFLLCLWSKRPDFLRRSASIKSNRRSRFSVKTDISTISWRKTNSDRF